MIRQAAARCSSHPAASRQSSSYDIPREVQTVCRYVTRIAHGHTAYIVSFVAK